MNPGRGISGGGGGRQRMLFVPDRLVPILHRCFGTAFGRHPGAVLFPAWKGRATAFVGSILLPNPELKFLENRLALRKMTRPRCAMRTDECGRLRLGTSSTAWGDTKRFSEKYWGKALVPGRGRGSRCSTARKRGDHKKIRLLYF